MRERLLLLLDDIAAAALSRDLRRPLEGRRLRRGPQVRAGLALLGGGDLLSGLSQRRRDNPGAFLGRCGKILFESRRTW